MIWDSLESCRDGKEPTVMLRNPVDNYIVAMDVTRRSLESSGRSSRARLRTTVEKDYSETNQASVTELDQFIVDREELRNKA